MNLPFVPDQPQDQQVQTEDPKDVPITECHKLFPHTLTLSLPSFSRDLGGLNTPLFLDRLPSQASVG